MSVALLEDHQTTSQSLENPHRPAGTIYTGTVLLRTRPKTYKRIVTLLSEGRSVVSIAKECRTAERSVIAVRNREASTIAERKSSLVNLMLNAAEIGGERVVNTIAKAGCRDAIIGTGVAIDKALALLGQSPAQVQIANVTLPSPEDRQERRELHDKLDAIAARLNA